MSRDSLGGGAYTAAEGAHRVAQPPEHRGRGYNHHGLVTCYHYWALVRDWGQTRRGSLKRVKRAAVWGASRSNGIPALATSCNRGTRLLQSHGVHPMGGRNERGRKRS
jgi:hypothetical protein